jgi:cytochrome c-type biogenesis protein CcmH/NrfG
VLWFLLWAVLVLGAAGVFFLLGRDLWRKSRALVHELTTATDRLTELGDRLSDLDRDAAHGNPRNSSVVDVGDVRSPGSSPRQQR